MAEGTGLEPYSPCQGLVRGQGGFQDVHACVDLTIHLPVAHQADEHLAHPISAPGATHWAGLASPRGIDLDEGHARQGGLVLNLAMDFATGPRGEATVHSTGVAARLKLGEGLKDDSHPTFLGERYESFRNGMEPLTYSVMLPPSLPAEQALSDPPVIGLFRRKSPTAGEVNALDLPHSIEGYRDEIHPLPRHDHSVHRILVRVEGNRALRFVCFWRLPTNCDNDFPRNDRERSEAPQGIRKDRPMHFGQREI